MMHRYAIILCDVTVGRKDRINELFSFSDLFKYLLYLNFMHEPLPGSFVPS